MPLFKLFTLPKTLLTTAEEFTKAGGKLTEVDAQELARLSKASLTETQRSELLGKFGEDATVKGLGEEVSNFRPGGSMARLTQESIDYRLMALELSEAAGKPSFDPKALSPVNFLGGGGTLDNIGVKLKRIKDARKEQEIMAEARARSEEAAKPVVDISKFRRLGDVPDDFSSN